LREFVAREGSKYAGIHKVYESREEFRKENPIAKLYKWNTEEYMAIETGDWTEAEDGLIVQLLYRYNINRLERLQTIVFRFPQGSFGVYHRMDGTWRYPQFYAMFTNGHKGSLSHSSNRQSDFDKIRFAAMVMAGMDARQAYRSVFQSNGRRFLTAGQLNSKVVRLFMDPIVQKEIKQHVVAFKDNVKGDITLKDVVDKIKSHWGSVKPGSAQEMKAIEFMMEIHDVVAVDESTGRKKIINRGDNIEDAEFTEESAPRLGPSDE